MCHHDQCLCDENVSPRQKNVTKSKVFCEENMSACTFLYRSRDMMRFFFKNVAITKILCLSERVDSAIMRV